MQRWEYPSEYLDKVRELVNTKPRDPEMQQQLLLMREGMEHGDFNAFNRALSEIRQEEVIARLEDTVEETLTWWELCGPSGLEANLEPWLLHHAFYYNALKGPEEYAIALADAWASAEWPEQYMDASLWVEYFNEVGYIEDGEMAPAPTEPIVVWRGACESHRLGMAWTTNPAVANWFASRWIGLDDSEPVKVLRLTVQPDQILAHITGRAEDEYVIDPFSLVDAEPEEFEINSKPKFQKPYEPEDA